MNITKEQMLDWLYQAIAMKRRGDGLRVIADGQWNADMRSAIRSLIESSGDKAVPASDRLTVPCENDPMPAEVEEAMRWFNDVLSLLESINIRIDETDAPHVAVIRAALSKPPVSVTREWIRKCVRGWMDCSCPTSIEDLVIDIIREKGIEVEEKP